MPRCWATERRPLWPASPPPSRTCSRPCSRSLSSWTTRIASGSSLKNVHGRLDRPPGLVHVGLGLEQRHPVLVDPHLGEPAVELAAPRAAVPARELLDDHEADVVAVARVLAPRVAEPDDEQVERRGAFAPSPGQAHEELLLGFGLVAAAVLGGLGRLGRGLGLSALGAPSAPSSTSSATSSRASWTDAMHGLVGVVEQRDALGNRRSRASRSVSPIPSSETSTSRRPAAPRAAAPRC